MDDFTEEYQQKKASRLTRKVIKNVIKPSNPKIQQNGESIKKTEPRKSIIHEKILQKQKKKNIVPPLFEVDDDGSEKKRNEHLNGCNKTSIPLVDATLSHAERDQWLNLFKQMDLKKLLEFTATNVDSFSNGQNEKEQDLVFRVTVLNDITGDATERIQNLRNSRNVVGLKEKEL